MEQQQHGPTGFQSTQLLEPVQQTESNAGAARRDGDEDAAQILEEWDRQYREAEAGGGSAPTPHTGGRRRSVLRDDTGSLGMAMASQPSLRRSDHGPTGSGELR